MAMLLKGGPAAAALTEELTLQVSALRQAGIVPTLAILRVGQRPEDLSYESGAMKRCGQIGIDVKRYCLAENCSRETLLRTVRTINEDSSVHGCLFFRPLPNPEDERAVCRLLSPEKDVDGVTPGALGAVFTGYGEGYPPCTAQACLALLDFYRVPVAGKRVTVVGRSLVVGRPVSLLLQHRDATVTVCHSQTRDLPKICREADILVAAAGRMGLIRREWVRPGQVVLDVGIHTGPDGKLRGDVCFEEAEPVAAALTPVPGGVGAMTSSILAAHVVESAGRSRR